MLLKSLNLKQQEAVKIITGPLLIIAGPGSGKTKVLTHRIAYLIQNGIYPENILAVTFTNKAAEEIRSRLAALLAGQLPTKDSSTGTRLVSPTAGTFHAICAQILRREINSLDLKPLDSKFVIYDDEDSRNLVKKIIKNLELSDEYFKPNSVLGNISQAKSEFIDEESYEVSASDYYPQTISKIYYLYQAALKNANALDFDDLLMLTVKIFQQNPAVLQKYQERFKYILIDEYQDTNHAQYLLVNLLAQKYKNVCAVGDDAQSIYGWRGADIRNILNFQHDYPEAKIIFLEQNYRSTQTILTAADAVISQNSNKFEKKLWTENEFGKPIIIYQAEDEKDEADFIVREISSLKYYDHLEFKDFAIFYRTNAQSRAIEEAFLRHKIPYKIIGGIKFYSRREIKDLLAYLRIIQNPHDQVGLARVINIPPRGIGAKTQEMIFHPAGEVIDNKKVKSFFELIDRFRRTAEQKTLSQLLKEIIDQTGYEQYAREISHQAKEGEERLENIQELFTVVKSYDHLPWSEALNIFLEQTALMSNGDEVEAKENLVNLMTMHCAKGLEFPAVFISGCEEGLLPFSKSYVDPFEMEEERRLCYVGLTRAKKLIYMTLARQRNLYGMTYANEPSRFISEIPEGLTKKKLI